MGDRRAVGIHPPRSVADTEARKEFPKFLLREGGPAQPGSAPGGTGEQNPPSKGPKAHPPGLSQGAPSPQVAGVRAWRVPQARPQGQPGGEGALASLPAPPAAHFFCLTGGVSAGKLSPAVCKHPSRSAVRLPSAAASLAHRRHTSCPAWHRAPRGLPQSQPGGLSPSALCLEASRSGSSPHTTQPSPPVASAAPKDLWTQEESNIPVAQRRFWWNHRTLGSGCIGEH